MPKDEDEGSGKRVNVQKLTREFHDNPLYSNPILDGIRACDYYG